MYTKFTKNDIRNGDIVFRRNGDVELALRNPDVFLTKLSYHPWYNVNDDLTSTINKHKDIIKVIRPYVGWMYNISLFEKEYIKYREGYEVVYEEPKMEDYIYGEEILGKISKLQDECQKKYGHKGIEMFCDMLKECF